MVTTTRIAAFSLSIMTCALSAVSLPVLSTDAVEITSTIASGVSGFAFGAYKVPPVRTVCGLLGVEALHTAIALGLYNAEGRQSLKDNLGLIKDMSDVHLRTAGAFSAGYGAGRLIRLFGDRRLAKKMTFKSRCQRLFCRLGK